MSVTNANSIIRFPSIYISIYIYIYIYIYICITLVTCCHACAHRSKKENSTLPHPWNSAA